MAIATYSGGIPTEEQIREDLGLTATESATPLTLTPTQTIFALVRHALWASNIENADAAIDVIDELQRNHFPE